MVGILLLIVNFIEGYLTRISDLMILVGASKLEGPIIYLFVKDCQNLK